MKINQNIQKFLARIIETDEQTLSNHINGVVDLSAEFSDYKKISYLIGSLHDIGKATNAFQDYLENGGKRGDIIHALQGGFFIDDVIGDSTETAHVVIKEIVALVIAAHHGSLSDGISPDGENIFLQKLTRKDDAKYHYFEVKQNSERFTEQISDLISGAKEEIDTVLNLIQNTYSQSESAQFALGLFVKYIYSCLIDADRLDAYLFSENEQYNPPVTDWSGLIHTFEKNIQTFRSETQIEKIRQAVSNQCKESATKSTGIYQLSVPTGGGKTLSSLRFALHHCKEANKKRIIYVIPYLSIIEQTASNLRDILNLKQENDIILEHHSNIVEPDDNKEREIRKLAAARWDQPIIITTMVQFLETVMSARGSNLRKFHNMSDSVIIFDEIQSLPIKTIHLFNETVSFLAKLRNSTVLLCTATQPCLHNTWRKNLLLEDNPKLIDCEGYFAEIKRTVIVAESEKDADGFAAFVMEKAQTNGDCLAIVNTKKSAKEIFYKLNEKNINDFEIYHLSTSMCSVHRSETLIRIKEALGKKNIICITTQLIEAGVDISFSCVVRAAAGLDSIVQAAGRCNRNGESDVPSEVFVVPLQGENLDRLDDIKFGKETTERLIRENKGADLSDSAIMEQFYNRYFYGKKGWMDHPLKDYKTIYDMLSLNDSGKRNYKNRTGKDAPCYIAHGFRTADENFYVIDKNAESVVVMYGEAETLIENYRRLPDIKEKLDIIKKLEKFSVSLYPHEMKVLEDVGAVGVPDEETGIKYLSKNYYLEDIGVVLEANPNDYIV